MMARGQELKELGETATIRGLHVIMGGRKEGGRGDNKSQHGPM